MGDTRWRRRSVQVVVLTAMLVALLSPLSARADEMTEPVAGAAEALAPASSSGIGGAYDELADAPLAVTSPDDVPTVTTGSVTESAPDGDAAAPTESASDAEDTLEAPVACLRYQAHVQNVGWQDTVGSGDVAGTAGQGLRLEALRVSVTDAAGVPLDGVLRYRLHVQNVGWQAWVGDGDIAGTEGAALRVEALMVKLGGSLAETHDVYYRVHVQRLGWMAWAHDGAAAGTTGASLRVEAVEIRLVAKGTSPDTNNEAYPSAFVGNVGLSVSAHVQDVGWQRAVGDGMTAGTAGRSLRLEALRVSVDALPCEGSVVYAAHVQRLGWLPEVADGAMAGTEGAALRVEAVSIRLTGELAERYDVYYRVHVATYGWLGWAVNGAPAGTSSMAKRVEALQVRLVAKGDAAPNDPGYANGLAYVSGAIVRYAARTVSGNWVDATDGVTAGTTGRSQPIDLMRATVTSHDSLDGTVVYAVSADGVTWDDPSTDGVAAGSEGTSASAVRFTLTGTLAKFFRIYYRAHVGNYGWLGWATNGASAGTAGHGLKVEAVEVVLVPLGNDAPGSTTYAYFDNATRSIGQLTCNANPRQLGVVAAAKVVPSPGAGLCAAWVSQVFRRAGVGDFGGDACDQYWWWCQLGATNDLKVGMIVAVARHSHTVLGRIYGHVGIYVGNGLVMDNVGTIRTVRLKDWTDYYGDLVTPRWGWLGGVRLA